MKIKVIISDDQPIVTNGLLHVLSKTDHIEIAGIYHDLSELLQNISWINADVLILDRNLQKGDMGEIVRTLRKMAPALRVLLFSSNDASYYVKKMLEAGCHGYLLKNADDATIITAIETVAGQEHYLSAPLAETLVEEQLSQPKTANKKTSLTRREQEVLELIVNEYTNPEIAAKLFLSPSTIESHRTSIQHKLGAKNTAGIVRVAFQAGLVYGTAGLSAQYA